MKLVMIIPLSPKRFDLNGLEAYKQNRGVAVFDRFVDFRYPEARSFRLISLLIMFLTLLIVRCIYLSPSDVKSIGL